jgi:hypothetical protein
MIPTISNTSTDLSVASGDTIDPFANVVINDANDYIHDTQLTITIEDGSGNPTDSDGTLTLNNNSGDLVKESTGTYVLTDYTPPSPSRTLDFFANDLPQLQFIASGSGSVTFALSMVDSDNEHTSDQSTVVNISGSAQASASPPTDTTPSPTDPTTGSSDPTVDNDGLLTIDHPHSYTDTVNLISGDIDLNHLASADSYSFNNDMISLYNSDGKVIDTLQLESGSSNFSVTKVNNIVSIYTSDSSQHPNGNLLSMHTS